MNKLDLKSRDTVYCNIYQRHALNTFVRTFRFFQREYQEQGKVPVLLCIGSDRATGDCLGPIVGQKLDDRLGNHSFTAMFPAVYGTLHNPVHAINLPSTIEKIYGTFPSPYIIALDASLGTPSHIGYVTLGNGPLLPGIGVNKKLPAIGDAFITGIVNASGGNTHATLQGTRLSTVVDLAEFIVSGIERAVY